MMREQKVQRLMNYLDDVGSAKYYRGQYFRDRKWRMWKNMIWAAAGFVAGMVLL